MRTAAMERPTSGTPKCLACRSCLRLTSLRLPVSLDVSLSRSGADINMWHSPYTLLSACLLCLSSVVALPTQQRLSAVPKPRPLVIWHGLGDSYAAPGMLGFIQEVKDMHPGLFVHAVYIKENNDEDQKATWVCPLYQVSTRRGWLTYLAVARKRQ